MPINRKRKSTRRYRYLYIFHCRTDGGHYWRSFGNSLDEMPTACMDWNVNLVK